jgi:O-succinylhomoserine sulfhydrylase
VDIRAVSAIAHAAGALVICDNVFATPIFSRAVEQGADVIVYSTTKHIDGQGRALGGVICGTRDFIRKTVEPYMKHTGGSMSPFTAWLHLNGLATLDLRCRAMADSALAVARALDGHPKLARTLYPGLPGHPQHRLAMDQMGSGGTLVTIDLAAGRDAAFRFLNALQVFLISNNLGDAKSIATHPATTTHQRLPQDQKDLLGITPGLVRLSIGLEDPADLIGDLADALTQA